MIPIDFHDQNGLIERLSADLVGSHPTCWDIILPPGFGEERFAQRPEAKGKLRRAKAKEEFPSFLVFALFAHARWRLLPQPPAVAAPETTVKQLEAQLSFYEQVRNGQAHSICTTTRRERAKYFELIERWLGVSLASCPIPVTVQELLEIIEPLPAVDVNGVVAW